MEWTNEQQHALDRVGEWLDNPGDKQVFRLFGFAGTGKTTLARSFSTGVNGHALFGAFTGKAALVLRSKGCVNASTIHQLIYRPRNKSAENLKDLQNEMAALVLANAEPPVIAEKQQEIRKEELNLKRPSFSLNLDSDLKDAALLVLDEVSMVGNLMGTDVMSFKCPVLALGDPAQLPPVGDGGYFTNSEPDVMLEEIHRQAEGSPIIAMSTKVRNGQLLPLGNYGTNCDVVAKGTLGIDELAAFDQVLCGTNKRRHTINNALRKFHGFKHHLPEPGDKLVCLRNNHELGLLNGSLWIVVESEEIEGDEDSFGLTLQDVDDSENTITTVAVRHHFEGRELKWFERDKGDEFDFGYCLTVHKAQGSQWPKVCVLDESFCFRQDALKWLYTGVTRAAEEVTIIKV